MIVMRILDEPRLTVSRDRTAENLRVIERLDRKRRGAPIAYRALWLEPNDGLAVSRCSFREQGGSVSVVVGAEDNADLSELMRALQRLPYVSEVTMAFAVTDAWSAARAATCRRAGMPARYGTEVNFRVDVGAAAPLPGGS